VSDAATIAIQYPIRPLAKAFFIVDLPSFVFWRSQAIYFLNYTGVDEQAVRCVVTETASFTFLTEALRRLNEALLAAQCRMEARLGITSQHYGF
jgi:hypothetical protein